MNKKKVLSLVLCGVFAICSMQTGVAKGMLGGMTKVQAKEMPKNPVVSEETGAVDYDYVYFGSYPQTEVTEAELTDAITDAKYNSDGDTTVDGVKYRRINRDSATYRPNTAVDAQDEAFYDWDKDYHYYKYEPIKWRVLQNEGSTLLLMADEALDCQKYSSAYERFSWATSPMRSWLNEYDGTQNAIKTNYKDLGGFITYAFSDDEKAAIQTSTVKTPENALYGVTGGADTNDKIFLMSAEELTNPSYGFDADYSTSDAARMIKPSNYAFAMGTWLGTYNDVNYGNCWWMLRTPGSYEQNIAVVYRNGVVYKEGYQVTTPYYAVCPALRVDANSDLWTIADDSNATEAPTATPTAEVTTVPSTVPSADPTTVPTAEAIMLGDLNNDKLVSLDDANIALKMALKITEYTDADKKVADVDGSGDIELEDANLILKKALKILTEFPIEKVLPTVAPTATVEPTVAPTVAPTATVEPTPAPLVQTSHEPTGRIWIAADSIAAKHDNSGTKVRDTIGWGVILNKYLSDSAVVFDTALSSRSSKSFTTEASYKYMMEGTTDSDSIIINGETQKKAVDGMKAGDYLLISFGHNDEFPQIERNTDPYGDSSTEGSFKWYLKTMYIDPAIQAGATPVLISPVAKRNFLDGKLCPQFHELYATAMQELSEEYAAQGIKVGYIDLHHKMVSLYQEFGDEQTKLLHACYYYDNVATMDNVHYTYAGAKYAIKYILEGLQGLGLDINQYRNEEAIKTLDNIELTDTFEEESIGIH